jgi:hypothetical protein
MNAEFFLIFLGICFFVWGLMQLREDKESFTESYSVKNSEGKTITVFLFFKNIPSKNREEVTAYALAIVSRWAIQLHTSHLSEADYDALEKMLDRRLSNMAFDCPVTLISVTA